MNMELCGLTPAVSPFYLWLFRIFRLFPIIVSDIFFAVYIYYRLIFRIGF